MSNLALFEHSQPAFSTAPFSRQTRISARDPLIYANFGGVPMIVLSPPRLDVVKRYQSESYKVRRAKVLLVTPQLHTAGAAQACICPDQMLPPSSLPFQTSTYGGESLAGQGHPRLAFSTDRRVAAALQLPEKRGGECSDHYARDASKHVRRDNNEMQFETTDRNITQMSLCMPSNIESANHTPVTYSSNSEHRLVDDATEYYRPASPLRTNEDLFAMYEKHLLSARSTNRPTESGNPIRVTGFSELLDF